MVKILVFVQHSTRKQQKYFSEYALRPFILIKSTYFLEPEEVKEIIQKILWGIKVKNVVRYVRNPEEYAGYNFYFTYLTDKISTFVNLGEIA